jgi:hypothetical protein
MGQSAYHILSVKELIVVTSDPLPEAENPRLIVGCVPRLGEARAELEIGVEIDEAFVDIAHEAERQVLVDRVWRESEG